MAMTRTDGPDKQSGYMVVSMSIAMLVAALLTMGVARTTLNNWKIDVGTGVGNQLQTINNALMAYMADHADPLIANKPITLPPPLSRDVVNIYAPSIVELKALGHLNAAVQEVPTAGAAYVIGISLTPPGCATGCTPMGYVHLREPMAGPDGRTSDVLVLSAAMNASKTNQIGFSLSDGVSPTTPLVTGKGWTFPNLDPRLRPGILYATSRLSADATTKPFWLKPAATRDALPPAGNSDGDGRFVLDTGKPYRWNNNTRSWHEMFSESGSVSIGDRSGKNNGTSVFIGTNAGATNKENGNGNVFVGVGAGEKNLDGSGNIFLGLRSGASNVNGHGNLFLGSDAGAKNKSGGNNLFMGNEAGSANTDASANLFVGHRSGKNNTTGSNNVFHGVMAGQENTVGSFNTFMGNYAGHKNTSGRDNVFSGYNAGFNNTVGEFNVFHGSYSGQSNTTGKFNVFTGAYAGSSNDAGSNNVFSGHLAGYENTSGSDNVFLGYSAGRMNGVGKNNVFAGVNSGTSNLTGSSNVFIGGGAGQTNSTGQSNVFQGALSGLLNVSGSTNVFTGDQAGLNNRTGNNNVFTGASAGWTNVGGANNAFYGAWSGMLNADASNNAFFGYLSGHRNISGNDNVFVGQSSGAFNRLGSRNTLIGSGSDVAREDLTNASAIGQGAIATASNSVRIGNASVNLIGGAVAWSNLSDRRLKTDVQPSSRGLDFVRKLQPVDYVLKDSGKPDTGFIAQDVESIDPAFAGINKPTHEGDAYSLAYTAFIPSLVKSIQELDLKIGQRPSEAVELGASFKSWVIGVLALQFVWIFGLTRRHGQLNKELRRLQDGLAGGQWGAAGHARAR